MQLPFDIPLLTVGTDFAVVRLVLLLQEAMC
jgi:hypothetical protein